MKGIEMLDKRTCISCAHYRADAPQDFPGFCGGLHQLRDYLASKRHKINEDVGWPGKCRAEPVLVAKRSFDTCSRWAPNMQLMLHWSDYCARADYWHEVRELKEKLKAAKQLAVDRFRRIKQLVAKPPAVKAVRDDRERLRKALNEAATALHTQEKTITDLRKQLAPSPAYIRLNEQLEADLRYTRQELKAHRKQHDESIRSLVSQYEGIIKDMRAAGKPVESFGLVPRDALGTGYVMPPVNAD